MRDEKFNRFNGWKILAHAEKIKAGLAGQITAPVEWVIYPANVCGYRCPHCIMAKEQIDHKQMLSKKAMHSIPCDAMNHGIECIIFSGGGDPLVNPYTYEIAGMCKSLGILTGINNQGYLLDDPRAFNFVRYSVDAATPETYQKIHQVPRKDGWERVVKNIANHEALRKSGEQIEMGLAFLITPSNYHEVSLFCDWAQEFSPDFVHLRPAYLDADYLDQQYPGGGDALKNEIIPRLRETAKELELKYDNVYFRIDKFEGYWTPKRYPACRANTLMAVTSGDGAFLVCQDRGIRNEENYLRWGNYNIQSFQEIWWSDEHKKVISSIDLPKCPRCVLNFYNEAIEHVFVQDQLKVNLI